MLEPPTSPCQSTSRHWPYHRQRGCGLHASAPPSPNSGWRTTYHSSRGSVIKARGHGRACHSCFRARLGLARKTVSAPTQEATGSCEMTVRACNHVHLDWRARAESQTQSCTYLPTQSGEIYHKYLGDVPSRQWYVASSKPVLIIRVLTYRGCVVNKRPQRWDEKGPAADRDGAASAVRKGAQSCSCPSNSLDGTAHSKQQASPPSSPRRAQIYFF